MTILRVGTSQKYSDNFAQAFSGKKAAGKTAAKKTAAKKAPVKSAKKKGATGTKKAAKKKK